MALSGLLALAALCLPVSAQAPTGLRIALVIGNSAYAGDAALPNPVNDARAMAQTLRQLGFTVVELRNASRTQMTEAISSVRESLKGHQGVGMLYYAGHGLQ
ncbi:MAG: caspase family protein, partial [Burkholderiaceae bacterium]